MSWGWGDYWGALCIVAFLVAFGGLAAGGRVFVVLAGVLGYFGLNLLQNRIEAVELEDEPEIYDQDRRS